jgi:hypothetical protein
LKGEPGKDGYTPVYGIDYFNGLPGKDGADGKTPVKGADYWTAADIQSMVTEAVNGVLAQKATILETAYPVGAIYMSTVSTSPKTLFGFGTWERIQDRFLLSAGSTYSAGTTGGEATHVLSTNELPSHTHVQLGSSGGAANSSPVRQVFQSDGNVVVYGSDGTAVWATMKMSSAATVYRTTTINVDGVTGSTGGGKAHNNMPPYLAVYVWKRTERTVKRKRLFFENVQHRLNVGTSFKNFYHFALADYRASCGVDENGVLRHHFKQLTAKRSAGFGSE